MNATKQERGTSRKIAALEAECDRLRGLLVIAREGCNIACGAMSAVMPEDAPAIVRVNEHYVRSDPDAPPPVEAP